MDNNHKDSGNNAGYVHDPEAFRERTDSDTTTASDETDTGPRTTKAYLAGDESPDEQDFGRRGWMLVGMLFIAFAVVPATILYLPQARPLITSLGLTYRDAYLVLPLVPALVLGAMAVWTAVNTQTV
jgi:hypothetical protein